MAGFQSALSILPTLAQGAGLAAGVVTSLSAAQAQRADQDLALRQLQDRQSAGLRAAQEQAALERQRLTEQATQQEADRRTALKRAVARQRAQFGSAGIGAGGGGSAQAVLLGLFDESEEDRAMRSRLDSLRSSALDLGLSRQRRLNVLQATQLAERQRLDRIIF